MDQPFDVNFFVYQGTTFQRVLTWLIDGDAVDLTGCAALMQLRRTWPPSPVVFELSDGDGLTLGGVAGTIAIEIAASDTADFDFDTVRFDLKIVFPSGGETRRLVEGSIYLSQEVTVDE